MDYSRYFRDYPTPDGRFGPYGGCYLPPELEQAFREINAAYQSIARSAYFINELRRIRRSTIATGCRARSATARSTSNART